MASTFLLYGSTGFVGQAMARMAVERGLRPILAGRDQVKIQALAAELGLEGRSFDLQDAAALDQALADVDAVLHCAGPYLYTYRPMVEACLRRGVHYLDISGEIPVYAALAACEDQARERGVMILPGVGFDVVPTDCLAVFLKDQLPTATHLTLAFHGDGPAGIAPGTANTLVEMIPFGINLRRRDGELQPAPPEAATRMIDFGSGPVQANLLSWGDVFTGFYSTGIRNIQVYTVMAAGQRRMMAAIARFGPMFRWPIVRRMARRLIPAGSTAGERARTRTHVWGEVSDDAGNKQAARLHGPDAGVTWTCQAALAAIEHVLAGRVQPGFQTPARVFGPDFVLACAGVTRDRIETSP